MAEESSRADDEVLAWAAEVALRAPSILNTQPWRWRIAGGVLELYADPARRLEVIDPERRQLTISCGAALHHATTALAAAGCIVDVQRLPEPDQPDLLARIRCTDRRPPEPADIWRYQTIPLRHTDRRLFTDKVVPDGLLGTLRDAAESQHAHLHRVKREDVPTLASAVAQAQSAELSDPMYRAELRDWTQRPAGSNDGVSARTTTPTSQRTVPLRDFTLDQPGELQTISGHDTAAVYAILAGDSDEPDGWLRGGEALSAVLLTAVHEGLSASPISDVAEVTGTRVLLNELLNGTGYPYLALRFGVGDPTTAVPATPRHPAAEVIQRAG
jgi:hypothetical protein